MHHNGGILFFTKNIVPYSAVLHAIPYFIEYAERKSSGLDQDVG